MYIHKRFQKIRNLKQLSRQDLAKGIVSYSHLSNFEAGRNQLSDDILKSLAIKLEVPEAYFLEYRKIDPELKELLYQLEYLIKQENFDKAITLMQNIEVKYPFINSIYQEICFYLLKACIYMKTQKVREAIINFNDNVIYLVTGKDINNFSKYMAELYYYLMATKYFHDKDYIKSYDNYIKQLDFASNSLSKADIYHNVGIIFYNMNNIFNSISFAKQALDIYLQELRWEDICIEYILLGVLYWEDNQLDISKKHLLKALKASDNLDAYKYKSKIYHNLGLVYESYGDYDKALEYLHMSLELKKNSEDIDNITYSAIIEIYIKQNQIDKTEIILEEAKQVCLNKRDSYIFKKLEALIYFHKKNYSLYESYMENAFDYFYSIKDSRQIKFICKNLAEYYESLKRYKKACKYYKIAIEFKK